MNFFLKDHSYRKLEQFQVVKDVWKKMRRQTKMMYPKKFRSFMNAEVKIKKPKNCVKLFQHNENVYSIYKTLPISGFKGRKKWMALINSDGDFVKNNKS
jgi:hypothetical protein